MSLPKLADRTQLLNRLYNADKTRDSKFEAENLFLELLEAILVNAEIQTQEETMDYAYDLAERYAQVLGLRIGGRISDDEVRDDIRAMKAKEEGNK